jgi:ATP-binding cassette subfamily F protein 3
MISFNSVSKQFGPKILFKNASFQINPGEKIGLVGPNGNGKTTVFRMIVNDESWDHGTISKPDKIRIGFFRQDIENMSGRSVIEEVKSSDPELNKISEEIRKLENALTQELSEDEMSKVLDRYGDMQSQFERLGGYEIESRAAEVLSGLGFSKEDQQRDTGAFSGGWKMRIALAKILTYLPDVLMMDEPTNHLDLESILWLENWLSNFKGALIMTSHDREFMNKLVNKIIEVNHQKITTYSGNYDFYEKEKELRKSQLQAAAQRQEEMLAKEEEFIARFAARASHAAQVQSRVKKIEKIERIELIEEDAIPKFEWPATPRGGDEVVRLENLGKVYELESGKQKLVFKSASALVKRQDRVAVVGINGAGKSTLLKIISGQIEPSQGKLQMGPSIQMGYFSQNSMDLLDPESTIIDEVQSAIPQQSIGYIRNLLGAMLFSGDSVEKKIKFLSGGEKSRVVLATLLARPLNFLVLDEPTNHLDIGTRSVLLDAIKRFEGTVMIVSHDRHFLHEITTKVFELDQNQLLVTEGNLDYYLEKRALQTK